MRNKLIVSNLPFHITEEDLIELFEEFGVEAVTLTEHYAVVVFSTESGAFNALEEWNCAERWGRLLRVKWAKW